MQKILLLLCLFTATPLAAQLLEYGFVSPSDYKTFDGKTIGKSSIQYISGNYQMPLYVKRDNPKGRSLLTATISGKSARLHNEGEAKKGNPKEIINTGAMLTYVTSIAERWNLIATAGASLNTTPNYIRLQNIALTGGAIFTYSINKNLNIGIGAIATTAYGEPVVLPTPFINWKYEGKYSIELNMRGLPEFILSAQLNEKNRIILSPLAVERFSAVINIDGDNKLYSQNILKTTIGVIHRINHRLILSAEAGFTSYRRARIQERSYKAFWDDLFDSDKRHKFSPSGTISIALKYSIR